jgi:hypothetical protein
MQLTAVAAVLKCLSQQVLFEMTMLSPVDSFRYALHVRASFGATVAATLLLPLLLLQKLAEDKQLAADLWAASAAAVGWKECS